MLDLFSDDMRRDPYPAYDRMRAASPVLHLAQFELWMILDDDGVRRALSVHGPSLLPIRLTPGRCAGASA